MCGMEVTETVHDFDNSTFTMPIHLTYEDCWMEDNETVCETGDIYYDVNTTMLWETLTKITTWIVTDIMTITPASAQNGLET